MNANVPSDSQPDAQASGAQPGALNVTFDPTRVPVALRERPQWVLWKYVERGGKQTKMPIAADTGKGASSTDPSTWTTFGDAAAAWRASDGFAGIGFVFAADDPFAGLDLDDCIDPETGEMAAWGERVIRDLDSYTEISPSGRGVKVFARGSKPGKRCKTGYESGAIEMYDRDRFFTVTGQALGDSRGVADRHERIAALYAEVFADRARVDPTTRSKLDEQLIDEGLTDDEIIRLASDPKRRNKTTRELTGEKFANLFEGNWNAYFNSASEADSSVCWTMAYYTKDAVQIDRIFRSSGLVRPKWDEMHGAQAYGERTIANALSGVTGQYTKKKRAPRPSPASSRMSAGGRGGRGRSATACTKKARSPTPTTTT